MKINHRRLKWFLRATVEEIFEEYKDHVFYHEYDDMHFIFKDNGSDVLAVAHTDTVLSVKNQRVTASASTIQAKGLDDRLGCYLAMDYLPSIGINVDVLLTDHEETGHSTAQFVEDVIPSRYRYIVELDRAGTDYVDYDLGSTEIDTVLASLGMRKDTGAFSDISSLPDSFSNTPAINIGIGYHNAHGNDSYCNLGELQLQMERFTEFYHETNGLRFERDIEPTSYGWGYQDQNDDLYDILWCIDTLNSEELDLVQERIEDRRTELYRKEFSSNWDTVPCWKEGAE